MEVSKKYLHDKTVLALLTVLGALLVIGVSLTLLRFDAGKNPAIIAEYRQNLAGSGYISGKPADIYFLALFMVINSLGALVLSIRTYVIKRHIALFILAGAVLLNVLTMFVTSALISLQ